jgi:hypothetical protein
MGDLCIRCHYHSRVWFKGGWICFHESYCQECFEENKYF